MQRVTNAVSQLTLNRASSNSSMSSVDLEAFSPDVLEAIAAWARKAKKAVRKRMRLIAAQVQSQRAFGSSWREISKGSRRRIHGGPRQWQNYLVSQPEFIHRRM